MVALARSMTGAHPARPVLVISNRANAAGLAKAEGLGIPTQVIDHTAYADRAGFETALDAALTAQSADLVCLAGFMRILSADFITGWQDKILNIHPSLLPKFKGLNTHARALAADERHHGCSVHLVTADLDGGPVLGQAQLPIASDDTAESLAARVIALEHRLYPAVLRRVLHGNLACLKLSL